MISFTAFVMLVVGGGSSLPKTQSIILPNLPHVMQLRAQAEDDGRKQYDDRYTPVTLVALIGEREHGVSFQGGWSAEKFRRLDLINQSNFYRANIPFGTEMQPQPRICSKVTRYSFTLSINGENYTKRDGNQQRHLLPLIQLYSPFVGCSPVL